MFLEDCSININIQLKSLLGLIINVLIATEGLQKIFPDILILNGHSLWSNIVTNIVGSWSVCIHLYS